MPNYAVLVDTRDRQSAQMTYIPEENIEVISNTKVIGRNFFTLLFYWLNLMKCLHIHAVFLQVFLVISLILFNEN